MNPYNTLFVPGLWFNPKGSLASQISKHTTILNVLGKDIEERLWRLESYLDNHPEIINVVAHSAGCMVVAEALELGFMTNVKDVILLNPAPMPGIKFTPKDKVFWAMMKYIPRLALGKKIGLTYKDTKTLMTLTDDQIESLGNSLVPESGIFTRWIVVNQFRKSWVKILNRLSVRISIVSATDDQMVGSTWKKTEKVFPHARITRITGGHMHSLLHFRDIVGYALYGSI